MTVHDAIQIADAILPGEAAPEGEPDPRWQRIIEVGSFIKSDPGPVWEFVVRWGSHEDDDLRSAIATCLLEHLLEHHFDSIFPFVEGRAEADKLFADTFLRCWKFGQAETPDRATRFDGLKDRLS